ncbi:MAG TPA: hypothetical protein VMR73_01215 [Candidatus Paceibacterota bacterium]|nr:hypothetical protein [Candidatus Paceibacterota bacterium]
MQNSKIKTAGNKKLSQKGQALLAGLLLFAAGTGVLLSGLGYAQTKDVNDVRVSSISKQNFFSSESALEDSVYRLKTSNPLGATDNVSIAGSQGTASVTTTSGGEQITSLGTNNNYERNTAVTLSMGQNVLFNYGMQAGTGGISLKGGSGVYGNVYANGPITSDWSGFVTGTAVAASTASITGPGQNSFNIGKSGVGDAYAHKIVGVNVAGNLYCQTGSLSNKSCDTSRADPASQNFPVSQADISQWESDGASGGIIDGDEDIGTDPNTDVTLGPEEINGNLIVNSGGTLTVSGTLYVTGNVDITGDAVVNLSPSYGSHDGLIIANGTITVDTGSSVSGSGTDGSYMMLLTTSASNNAISISGGSSAVIVNAQNGTVNITGGASAQEVEGYQINLSGGSSITYQNGLANTIFLNGISPESYSISSWQETP